MVDRKLHTWWDGIVEGILAAHLTTCHPLDGRLEVRGHSYDHTRAARLSLCAYKNKLRVRKAAMPEFLRDLIE